MRLLLEHPDIDVDAGEGREGAFGEYTPLGWAKKYHHTEIIQLLKQHGARRSYYKGCRPGEHETEEQEDDNESESQSADSNSDS